MNPLCRKVGNIKWIGDFLASRVLKELICVLRSMLFVDNRQHFYIGSKLIRIIFAAILDFQILAIIVPIERIYYKIILSKIFTFSTLLSLSKIFIRKKRYRNRRRHEANFRRSLFAITELYEKRWKSYTSRTTETSSTSSTSSMEFFRGYR